MALQAGPRLRDAAVALSVGVAHAVWLFTNVADVTIRWPVLVWAGVGLTLLAAVPTALVLRRTLVAPAALVAWLSVSVLVAQGRPTPHGPFGLYAVGWFVPLGVALVAGAIEYAARRWTGVAPPRPLADL